MSVYIPVELQQKVREHFRYCCVYCHSSVSLIPVTFEFEHIVPLSAGGKTIFENLCFSCPMCNRYKATRQMAPDPETGENVALFHPQQDVWETHFAWNNKFTLLEGLTPTGRATIEALKMNRPQLERSRKLWVRLGEHPA